MSTDASVDPSFELSLAEVYAAICNESKDLPDVFEFLQEFPRASIAEKTDVLLVDLENRHEHQCLIGSEKYLHRFPEVALNHIQAVRVITAEYRIRHPRGDLASVDEWISRFPQYSESLRQSLLSTPTSKHASSISLTPLLPGTETNHALFHSPTAPMRIGKYRIERQIGMGGFGQVYLGFDETLHRQVAIKIFTSNRNTDEEAIQVYLKEGRILASLDHSAIVPVYDVGQSNDGICYIVSKYIEGRSLTDHLRQRRLHLTETISICQNLADALHYAHQRGLIHRDFKPDNVIIDHQGRPYLIDFGLAQYEFDIENSPSQVGTPAYMSPEQARRQHHRVDARSDIFSLGVVCYEMAVGSRPFEASSVHFLLQKIIHDEPAALHAINASIPEEFNRICMKAISKKAIDRYQSASELAQDLGRLLTSSSSQRRLDPGFIPRVIPKGLRSYDQHDSDFFLQLLPGPRDREGLPEILRFWKNRIETRQTMADARIGLIYGPSGCGKTSVIKAGLIPRLSPSIVPIYVESDAADLSARILNGIHKRLPDLPVGQSLEHILGAIRNGRGLDRGMKLLLVLDQFEQWLHGRTPQQHEQLIEALGQCDGERVQCMIVLRDDFWLGITRFMSDLEVSIRLNDNASCIDLFDVNHACKVLADFGRAYGRLPESGYQLLKEHQDFLRQTVESISQNGRVIPVQLALLAQMLQTHSWTTATLKSLGGVQGLGVRFLEEQFHSSPDRQPSDIAARSILTALLPSSNQDIRGLCQSYHQLAQAADMQDRLTEFDSLISRLDKELRLITPLDPDGIESNASIQPTTERYYQLTHDYLVPALRAWLTLKRRQTRRGRAEILITELTEDWIAKPSTTRLPNLWQWLTVTSLTRRQYWSVHQRRMMLQAHRHHGSHLLLALVFIAITAWFAQNTWNGFQAKSLQDQLLNADTTQWYGLLSQTQSYESQLSPRLRHKLIDLPQESRQQLVVSLALLPNDPSQLDSIMQRSLSATPDEFQVIRQWVPLHHPESFKEWQAVLMDASRSRSQRLRAAAGLAVAPKIESTLWDNHASMIVRWMIEDPDPSWSAMLTPIASRLIQTLQTLYLDNDPKVRERAAAALLTYSAHDFPALTDLLQKADAQQLRLLIPVLDSHRSRARSSLMGLLKHPEPLSVPEQEMDAFCTAQANIRLALFALGEEPPLWEALQNLSIPLTRALVIDRLPRCLINPQRMIIQLSQESNPTIRAAIYLILGNYSELDLPAERRQILAARFAEDYRQQPSPEVHSAIEWVLERWNRPDLIMPSTGRQPVNAPGWFVNRQGQTFAVIQGPVELKMSFRPRPENRLLPLRTCTVTIPRSFALGTTEVTLEQFLRFKPDHKYDPKLYPSPQHPVTSISRPLALAYCRWLSESEGIPESQMCVPPIDPSRNNPIELPEDCLERTGYRLPTEAEWEYANRARSAVQRPWGGMAQIMSQYVIWQGNSAGISSRTANLMPNPFGLFNLEGNISELCLDNYETASNIKDPLRIDDQIVDSSHGANLSNQLWITKGGSYLDPAQVFHFDYRSNMLNRGSSMVGLRIARTIR